MTSRVVITRIRNLNRFLAELEQSPVLLRVQYKFVKEHIAQCRQALYDLAPGEKVFLLRLIP